MPTYLRTHYIQHKVCYIVCLAIYIYAIQHKVMTVCYIACTYAWELHCTYMHADELSDCTYSVHYIAYSIYVCIYIYIASWGGGNGDEAGAPAS